ncbi:MAG TPA: hypothetical protein VFQ61_38630, partial [Polyangiaceae bacterium]|nr:hypothetical protein [Polyangiaceae bacterium]
QEQEHMQYVGNSKIILSKSAAGLGRAGVMLGALAALAAGCGRLEEFPDSDVGRAASAATICVTKEPNGPRGLLHTVSSVGSNQTRLAALANRELQLSVTQFWNPNTTTGVYNNHPVRTRFDGSSWIIETTDGGSLALGAAFNVLYSEPKILTLQSPSLIQSAPGPLGDAQPSIVDTKITNKAVLKNGPSSIGSDKLPPFFTSGKYAELTDSLSPSSKTAGDPPPEECPPDTGEHRAQPGVLVSERRYIDHVASSDNALYNYTCIPADSLLTRDALLIVEPGETTRDEERALGVWYRSPEHGLGSWCIFYQDVNLTMAPGTRFFVQVWTPE